MFSVHKNSYLQLHSSGVNPRIINRAVDLARRQRTTDPGNLEPPLNRLTSEQPCIPAKNVDPTRRPLAFGRWAIPKLTRELHSKDQTVVLQAVTSFVDLLHNPEKGYEALALKVPDRMADLLVHEQAAIRERVCLALTVITGLGDGKQAVVKNKKILTNLSLLLDDVEESVRIKAAACLERVSSFWVTADELIEFGFIPLLLDCVSKDVEPIAAIHLDTLEALMYAEEGVEQAIENDGFVTFCSMIESEFPRLKVNSLNCLSRLLGWPHGKQMAYDACLLPDLNRLLHDERPEVYIASAGAIVFATIKSCAKVRAAKIPQLPHRLVTLLQDSDNPLAQLNCLQILTNLCEHPDIRKVVSQNYYDKLEKVNVGDDLNLNRCKNNLLKMVNWQPQFG